MGKEGKEKGVVPAGSFDLSPEGCLVRVGPEEIEGKLSQEGEVFGSIVLAVSGAILVEDDVEHPMEAILDRPVRPGDMEQLLGGERLGEEEMADGNLLVLALDAPRCLDASDGA
jgi:hypothetical protein